MIKIGRQRTDVKSSEILKNTCPVCGYFTLSERDSFEICSICFWEDDGIDDFEADEESGPNRMTLNEARKVFLLAKDKLVNSDNSPEDLKGVIQKKFIKLDYLIEKNQTDHLEKIIKIQNEIVELLTKSKIYGIEHLLK